MSVEGDPDRSRSVRLVPLAAVLALAALAVVPSPARAAPTCLAEAACLLVDGAYSGTGACLPSEGYGYTQNRVIVTSPAGVFAGAGTYCQTYQGAGHTQLSVAAFVAGAGAGVLWNAQDGRGGFCWIRVTLAPVAAPQVDCPAGASPPRVPAVLP